MVPLVVRSHFSLLWGTASVKKLCRAVRERGYTHLALTDTDNLYGLIPFLTACRREEITPIVGAEVTDSKLPLRRGVCLVENEAGYRNLCRLLTRRHRAPDFDLTESVERFSEGLIVLTTDPELLRLWHEAGVRVAAALPRRPDGPAARARKEAQRLGLPAVVVPGSFFLDPDDFEVHRVLRAIDKNTSISRLGPTDLAPADAWFAPADEYRRRFAVYPEVIENTWRIAERLKFRGPEFGTVMPPWKDAAGRNAAEVLRAEAYEGARWRYGHDLSESAVGRLEHELDLIERKNFSSYFLVVRDIVRRSPRICGRGSGAASLVAYSLGITNVCPMKHDLYFERFLNADRKDPPDIDVDFAWDERDDVLNSVLEQYRGHSAMVCNHVYFQPRLAIREVAKVYGLTEREIDEVARRLPWFWHGHTFSTDLKTKLYTHPRSRSLEFPDPWPKIIATAQKIVGCPRHLSVHPGGVIITPRPIDEYVPIETATKGVPIIQWEKDGAEDAGLVKIDLLGNRSLGVIRDAVANVRENGDPFPEKDWDPEEDPATQASVAKGLTMGCFYIESPATRLLQKKAGVGDFGHLVIHSSIIRPAANEFINEYLLRLKGKPWEPIHPLLADVMEETFGIMVYQEDVSRTAVALAGFSHADADGLRKIMSKKDKERELADYRQQFVQGARKRDVSDEQIETVWNMMLSFSGYSFCKPHSASYARVSFQAAYLKTHHPAEFMAAVIGNQGGFYSTFAYVSEARRMGLTVLPPDVSHSRGRWTGRGDKLRVGLQAIKGLGGRTMDRIIEARREEPYRDFRDFHQRVRPDEDETRALIHAGALDELTEGRDHAGLLWELALAGTMKSAAAGGGPANLFDGPDPIPVPEIPAGREIERLRRQWSVLGFLTDAHPIVLFEHALPGGLIKAADLDQWVGQRVLLAGWLITGKLIQTKRGDPMQFLTFEDETGLVETVFFPRTYERFCGILDWNQPYVLAGKVEEDFGACTLTVDYVKKINNFTTETQRTQRKKYN